MPDEASQCCDDSEGQGSPANSLIDKLLALPIAQLREKWEQANPTKVLPYRLPRDLLVRDLAWQVQVRQNAGLAAENARALDRMARQLAMTGTLDIERSVRPKPGIRLIREWRGATYVVEASSDGFVHDGQTFASLSHVARAITGTRWSGPRFFGLRPQDLEGAGEGPADGAVA